MRMPILALALLAAAGCTRKERSPYAEAPAERASESRSPGHEDRAFLVKAAEINLAEIDAGKLAVEKASHAEAKKFGQHMIDDHSRAQEELKELARKKGLALPAQTDAEHRKGAAELAEKSGPEFDRKFMDMMTAGHVQAVALFEDKARTAKDVDVRAWAEKTLPVLQHHLEMARDIHGKVRGTADPY